MYILIDREKMFALYKHPNQGTLSNLAHIEVAHSATIILPQDLAEGFDQFTQLELQLLFYNLCGQRYTGYNKSTLIASVITQCKMLTESKLNGFEIGIQANSIDMDNQGFYRYAPGCSVPNLQQELFVPAALVTVAGYVPTYNPKGKPYVAPVRATQAAAPLAGTGQPTPTSAPSSAPTSAPKAGSKTGRVWEIAEVEYLKDSSDFKVLRKRIIDACEVEGINASTASVQYGYWKKTKL